MTNKTKTRKERRKRNNQRVFNVAHMSPTCILEEYLRYLSYPFWDET
jgi:hypothetical protein